MSVEDTLAQRHNTHGLFTDNGRIMQQLKNTIRGFRKTDIADRPTIPSFELLPPYQREALDMICHKIGRILSGNPDEPDHWHDIAGYATLVERIVRGEVR